MTTQNCYLVGHDCRRYSGADGLQQPQLVAGDKQLIFKSCIFGVDNLCSLSLGQRCFIKQSEMANEVVRRASKSSM